MDERTKAGLMRHLLTLTALLAVFSCQQKKEKVRKPETDATEIKVQVDSITEVKEPIPQSKSLEGVADTTFVRLADYSTDFAYDLRYATENNFLKEKVYDCAECYTRAGTAKALLAANKEFLQHGVKIKFLIVIDQILYSIKCGK